MRVGMLAAVFSLFSLPLLGGEQSKVEFISGVGESSVAGLEGARIVVSKEGDLIQFRIRGAGPAEPVIRSGDDWFIAIVDQDHYWVHLGGGRLFYYSWASESRSRVDEWTYPGLPEGMGLPSEVEARLRGEVGG